MLSRLYPDGEVPVRNYIGCILLSSRLLFGDDRIVCAEESRHTGLQLEKPLVSCRAAGKVIGCLAVVAIAASCAAELAFLRNNVG